MDSEHVARLEKIKVRLCTCEGKALRERHGHVDWTLGAGHEMREL
jgi:hypothetical protein